MSKDIIKLRKLPLNNPIRKIVYDGGYTSIFRTIGFVGDSLSSGEHESFSKDKGKGFHDYYEYSWGQFIARKCGLKAFNFSKGGMTAIQFLDFTQNKNDPLALNIFDNDKKCQAYVIALGVNDMNHLEERYGKFGFGSFDDVDFDDENNNKNSFVGCYVRIIQKLRKIEPKCRIFVLTKPKCKPIPTQEKKNDLVLNNFLRLLPKYFDFLYVVDLAKYAPVYNMKKLNGKLFCGTHMSAAGYKFTADIVATYIDSIIRRNPKDFTQVGFIGKDIHNELEKW